MVKQGLLRKGVFGIMIFRETGTIGRGVIPQVVIAWALVVGSAGALPGAEVIVDCSARLGEIRPLHGVNNGPVNYGETVDLSQYYRQLAIPFVRLHDSEWPNPDVVDIHAVFPDLHGDPGAEKDYRFSRTDDYIRAIVDTGAGIVYRLGESIEHSKKKYNVAPPGDYEKWAAACIGIIRHYNEGWANGPRHGIRYWEIWNEPENRPSMWTGSDEDYYRLYGTAARAIKARFGDVMVGGPSVGAQGQLVEGHLQPSPFLRGFLEYCRDNSVPLDFFSWHTYTDDPYLFAQKARAIRVLLNEYGFARTESHLNEWNYLPENDWTPLSLAGQGLKRRRWFEKMGGAQGAAFVVCALIYLQDSPIDVANYYAGDTNPFGLFDRYGAPKKTFYAMKAFRMLLDTPVRVKASAGRPGESAVCAGMNKDNTELTILAGSFRAEDNELRLRIEHLPWRGETVREVLRLDSEHDLVSIRSEVLGSDEPDCTEPCEAPCVLVIKLRKGAGTSNSSR